MRAPTLLPPIIIQNNLNDKDREIRVQFAWHRTPAPSSDLSSVTRHALSKLSKEQPIGSLLVDQLVVIGDGVDLNFVKHCSKRVGKG